MTQSPSSTRRILLTCALPYANGSLHLGHVLEHLYADFWTRFQKMRGHEIHFVCADDTHGTPIMVEARKRGITPEKLIADAWNEHVQDFRDFQIDHSHYSSTNSEANRELCEYFFSKMQSKGHIASKTVEQLYCEHDKMFLPDRFVKGECPKCGSKGMYGDSCDSCAATYSPKELKNPACAICGHPPVVKPSEQLMFRLNDFNEYLKNWLPSHTTKEIANKMMEWFNEPLRDWDISRNAPYFGFQIPGHKDKYFYVWVDAPMGYVSSMREHCQKLGIDFANYWQTENSEVYHLIGKDIVYFHTLFWPALLKAADFRSPSQVWVHGFINVNGEKMSKSKGTFLSARTYLNHLDPIFMRYYLASKLTQGVDDLDFNLDDFVSRTNSELVGKITNLASRGAQMLNAKFAGKMTEPDSQGKNLLLRAQQSEKSIGQFYENREFAKAIAEIRGLADEANRYFDEKAPWKTSDSDPLATQQVLTTTLNLFRLLAIYLKPILPLYSDRVSELFSEPSYQWSSSEKILSHHQIKDYQHLATRIDPVKVKAMMEANKQELAEKAARDAKASPPKESTKTDSSSISIDDFLKIDLRVGEIVEAEEIAEADKLLRLKVNLGELGDKQIIAGIKSAYSAKDLIGRKVSVVTNLAPRKMKFGISEGMVLAAGAGGKELFVLSPDNGAKAGDKIK